GIDLPVRLDAIGGEERRQRQRRDRLADDGEDHRLPLVPFVDERAGERTHKDPRQRRRQYDSGELSGRRVALKHPDAEHERRHAGSDDRQELAEPDDQEDARTFGEKKMHVPRSMMNLEGWRRTHNHPQVEAALAFWSGVFRAETWDTALREQP